MAKPKPPGPVRKTTVELSEKTFLAAKLRAAQERVPLRDVIEQALRAYLKGGSHGAR